MAGEAQHTGGQADFEALVAQCLARIRAQARQSADEAAYSQDLARRLAMIVSSNLRRGRVPQTGSPDPTTGVPDSYVDAVLAHLRQQEPVLRALRDGQGEAWESLLAMLGQRAYGYLTQRGVERGQARQLAQDLAQSAAATLWEQALESFPYDTQFDAWVTRIVSYEVSRWGRSTKEQAEQRALSLDAVPDSRVRDALYEILPDLGASRAMDLAEMRMALKDALVQLPANQRAVIVRQLAGETTQEIARDLVRSRQAVYNLRHRAIRRLRRILRKSRRG